MIARLRQELRIRHCLCKLFIDMALCHVRHIFLGDDIILMKVTFNSRRQYLTLEDDIYEFANVFANCSLI